MTRTKKLEKQYLDFVNGWMTYERNHSCVGKAVLVQEKDRPWSSWHVTSATRHDEEWKFKYALFVHGKDPHNRIVPPKQVPPESFRKEHADCAQLGKE